MKKFLIIIIFLLIITGCRTSDSVLFKLEYEKYNNSNYTNLSIPSNNPFVYIKDVDLVKKIENKDDMVVLFGYSKSNDTRNIIDSLINTCNKYKIDKIYYLDILNIRDLKEIEDGNIVTKKEGSSSYLKILELLHDYVNEYIVKNEIVGTRIYAPSILVIKNKNISFENVKSYLDTKEEQDNDIKTRIDNLLKDYNVNTCDVNEGC